MKREALEEVVDRHIGKIEKYSKQLPGSFDQSAIHDLRVHYKKVRAFLRLLQLEKGVGDLNVPAKLRSLYHHCGHVRDWQLFLIELHSENVAAKIPACMHRLNQQLFTYKEQTVHAIELMHFKKILSGIIKALPRQLHDSTFDKFMQQKIAAIHIILLAADNEKDLHSIRKQIKDIIYIMRICESDWGISFPVSDWKNEKELDDIASALGDFNDRCLSVSLLQSGYSDDCDNDEKVQLQKLQAAWVQQKEKQQRQLLQQVQQLRMEHAY